jgi:Uma2 family endonuclease
MTTRPAPKKLTIDDWLTYDVPEGLHAELVDGVLEMNPLAEPPHQIALQRMIRQLDVFLYLHPNDELWWSSPGRLPIPGTSRGREPDLAIYDKYPHGLVGPLAWKRLSPVIVVEVVSPGQEVRDHADKRRDYFLAKVPEYWIVDLERRLFLALLRAEAGWNEIQLAETGTYPTPLLPGFELDIGKLWIEPGTAAPAGKGERSERPRGARADATRASEATSKPTRSPGPKRVRRPR